MAKIRDLMTPAIGAASPIDIVLAMETVQDVRTLRPLLQQR